MTRTIGPAPSADEIEAMARAALARLPAQFLAHLGDVVLRVEEFADDALLAEMGIEDPFELTGVYEGTPLHEKSIEPLGHACPTASACSASRSSTNGSRAATRHWSTSSRMCWCTRSATISASVDEAMHALEEAAG